MRAKKRIILICISIFIFLGNLTIGAPNCGKCGTLPFPSTECRYECDDSSCVDYSSDCPTAVTCPASCTYGCIPNTDECNPPPTTTINYQDTSNWQAYQYTNANYNSITDSGWQNIEQNIIPITKIAQIPPDKIDVNLVQDVSKLTIAQIEYSNNIQSLIISGKISQLSDTTLNQYINKITTQPVSSQNQTLLLDILSELYQQNIYLQLSDNRGGPQNSDRILRWNPTYKEAIK